MTTEQTLRQQQKGYAIACPAPGCAGGFDGDKLCQTCNGDGSIWIRETKRSFWHRHNLGIMAVIALLAFAMALIVIFK